jgi:hypothetical protein
MHMIIKAKVVLSQKGSKTFCYWTRNTNQVASIEEEARSQIKYSFENINS